LKGRGVKEESFENLTRGPGAKPSATGSHGGLGVKPLEAMEVWELQWLKKICNFEVKV